MFRYRLYMVTGAVVVALTAALTVVVATQNDEVRAEFQVPSPVMTATVPGTPEEALGAAPTAAPAAPASDAPKPVTVRWGFDGGVADAGGPVPLVPRLAAGGVLESLPHDGRGLGVRFPRRCPHYGSASCKRGILQSGPADVLNPGRSPFRYGATIRLAPNETSAGANVLQKGYAIGDSQFKLQVDGGAGQPSCVLVGHGGKRIYLATSAVSVADGQWHDVQCARRDGTLTITVDGTVRGRTGVPDSLSIVNKDPLCVGGKGTGPNNDQFNGAVDDVYVTLEP